MKGEKAKVNKIFSATACLVVSLALAIFSCFAWFVNNRSSSSGLNAGVDGEFITDFDYTAYALTGKSETISGDTTTTSYTIYTPAEETAYINTDGSFKSDAITQYGSSTVVATLLVVTYRVNGGKDTKITFNGTDKDDITVDKIDVAANAEGNTTGEAYSYVETQLSNAVSMRLASVDGATVSSDAAARCLMDSTAANAKQEAIFNEVTATKTADETGTYYLVTLNILLEYDDDNVTALYAMNSGANLSMPIGFTNDLNVTVEAADEEHTHTYGKWTVTEYVEEEGIAVVSDGGEEEDDPYLYTATRTCTGCSSSTEGHTQTVNIKQSEIITNSAANSATASVTVDGVKCTITFSTAAASSGSSDADAITVTTTIDLTSYSGDEITGTTCEWNGITIDTTADGASLAASSDGYVQITAGTVLTLNVATNATVTVTYYGSYSEGCTISVINGVATITCTADTCITSITVTVPVTISSVTISGGSSSMYIGGSSNLTAAVALSDGSAYDGTITWTSSNTSVVTVSESGVATAVAAGTATITATATLDGVSANATLAVTVTCENHTWAAAVTENYVEATCTENGSYDTVYYCSVCGTELSRETTTIYATGSHTYSADEWVYDSSTHWNVCTVCGEKLNEASHTYGSDGYCTVCGANENTTVVAIFSEDDTTLASGAGFTVSSGSYKSGVTFTYNGTTYNNPLKLESSTSITFKTTEEMTMTIGIYTAGGNLNVDGTTYTDDDSDGIITISSLAAGDHTISKGSGDPNLCYVVLTPASGTSTHTHTYEATWYWYLDNYYVGVALLCSSCYDYQWVDATYTSETTEATCTEDGSIVYTATATYDGVTYTDTYTVTISATGEHTYTWTYDDSEHWQVCSVCGTTTEAEAHTFENGTCTVCGATETTATATDHTSTFSISELVTAVETRTGTGITDGTQLAKTDFTGSNSFLTLLTEQTANQYRTNNNGVIEIKGEGLSVTFTGTGTITITFASTGGSNTSSLALVDSNGKYITGTTTDATAASNTNGNYYSVTGTSYVTVTFTITEAGTYTIATNVGSEGRGARISSIEMVDTYVDSTNE